MTQTGQSAIEERRRHERLAAEFKIHYSLLEDLDAPGGERSAEMCDFSGGGVRFLCDSLLDKQSQLLIRIEFMGWKDEGGEWIRTGSKDDVGVLKALGRVMWCAASEQRHGFYEAGVMFTGRMTEGTRPRS